MARPPLHRRLPELPLDTDVWPSLAVALKEVPDEEVAHHLGLVASWLEEADGAGIDRIDLFDGLCALHRAGAANFSDWPDSCRKVTESALLDLMVQAELTR